MQENKNKANENQAEELDINHLMQIRRDKLAELKKDKQEETQEEVTVPELRNKTVEEAKKELKEIGLELEIKQEVENELENEINTKEKVIIEQVPKPEVKIRSGNKVTVEIE